MSSMDEAQGPYQSRMELPSANIDDFITAHAINVLVMDIEGQSVICFPMPICRALSGFFWNCMTIFMGLPVSVTSPMP